MQTSKQHLSTIFTYYTWYLLAIVIVASGALLSAKYGISFNTLPAVQYNTFECFTGKESNNDVFQFYAYEEEQAVLIANALCTSPDQDPQFQSIQASWQLRDQSLSRVIFDKQYQLIVMKPELMELYDINLNDLYLPVASYGDYSSRFISLESEPRMESEYFQNRRLGLLDSSDSVSGYKLPKLALRNANIDESLLSILFFESHKDLYQALVSGDVDVIASGIQLPIDKEINRYHYTLPIPSNLRGARWYLHPDLINTSLHCSLDSIFSRLAKSSPILYDRSLKVLEPCLE